MSPPCQSRQAKPAARAEREERRAKRKTSGPLSALVLWFSLPYHPPPPPHTCQSRGACTLGWGSILIPSRAPPSPSSPSGPGCPSSSCNQGMMSSCHQRVRQGGSGWGGGTREEWETGAGESHHHERRERMGRGEEGGGPYLTLGNHGLGWAGLAGLAECWVRPSTSGNLIAAAEDPFGWVLCGETGIGRLLACWQR